MSKAFMTKGKIVTVLVAVLLTALIIFGGTFAWSSISQQALNEVAASANPGGRLHDDFVDITFGDDDVADYDTMTFNKDVYVENFTSLADNGAQVFARIRLDEYMEFGVGAGMLNADGDGPHADNKAESLVPGAKLENKNSWSTYRYGEDSEFRKYWELNFGGQTVYMPTFNKNKDSLEADINGTFRNNFDDHIEYTTDTTTGITFTEGVDTLPVAGEVYEYTGTAIYDKDTNADDELVLNNLSIADAVTNGHITARTETHLAKDTILGTVMSMEEWVAAGSVPGDYWVYDDDGWAYWANPISPGTATGLLLDQINRIQDSVINEDWYYAINVVAQFISKDGLGQDTGDEGFYDSKDGSVPPSEDALKLLSKIGVDVTFEVDTLQELQTALTHGGHITLTADIVGLDTNLVVSADATLDLGTHTISGTGILAGGTGAMSLISVQGADTVFTIKGGNFIAEANDSYVMDVRDGAKVVIDGGTFNGNVSAVYVYEGSLLINGGTFSIQQTGATGEEYTRVIDAEDTNFAAETAKITICGGTFHGMNPTAANDGNLVARGYEMNIEADGSYTVTP